MPEKTLMEQEAREARDLFVGVTGISVQYAGSGDNGCIDDVSLVGKLGSIRPTPQQKEFIEERCYDLLNDLPDWVNNEGGRGDVQINVAENSMHFTHEVFSNVSDGRRETDQPVPAMVAELLRLLPSNVVTLEAEFDTYSEPLITPVDRQGRPVTLTDRTTITALIHQLRGWCDDYPAHRDALEDSERYTLSIDCAARDADIEIRWDEQTSDVGEHTFEFIEGLALIPQPPTGLRGLVQRYRA